jgi:ABC-2 type transport system permease protein
VSKFLWLIRRELWESRAVWVAPALCAVVIVGGLIIASIAHGTLTFDPQDAADVAQLNTMPPAKADAVASIALGVIALPFFILVLFTQFLYALDSLYGDRRDRSILFWKSLPVSDTESVLAKLTVAAVIFPLAALAAALMTQVIVFGIASVALSGMSVLAGHFWSVATWAGSLLVMGYLYVASALWYLPLIGWALLVSAWAPRSPLLWAALPPLALSLLEVIVLRSSHVAHAVGERVGNASLFGRAFGMSHATGFTFAVKMDKGTLTIPRALTDMMRPAEFFSSPSLWIGVLVAVLFVAAAIWVRRHRDASS